jgi:hypothetical protein
MSATPSEQGRLRFAQPQQPAKRKPLQSSVVVVELAATVAGVAALPSELRRHFEKRTP